MSHYWRGSGPLRRGREHDDWVAPGEEFEPTDAERAAFADLIEAVEDASEDEDDDDEGADGADEPDVEAPFDPGEYSVNELREALADADYSDAEREALEAAERAGEHRTTALEAITGIR